MTVKSRKFEEKFEYFLCRWSLQFFARVSESHSRDRSLRRKPAQKVIKKLKN